MRIRIPARRGVVFAAMFVFALILFLPLRLALGAIDSGLAAREASGSVWSGSLKEARIGPAALGDLDARLAFLPLLTGEARIEVARPSAAPDGLAGAFGIGRNRRSVSGVTGMIPVEGNLGALPVSAFRLTDVTVRFRDDQCERAEGLVTADLSNAGPGQALPASLSGAPRCDRGAVLLPLKGGTGGVDVRLFGDGRWEAQIPDGGANVSGRF